MIMVGRSRRMRRADREHVWTPGLASAMVSDRTRAAWLQGCADVAQLVEHHLAKVRVAGSNPVVRSERVSPSPNGEQCFLVEWPRGEATDCKSVYTGSNPVSTSGDWRSGSALP
jgi:hypothetical protein